MKAISKLKDEARRHEQKEEWDRAIQAYLQVIRAGEDAGGDVELPLFNRIGDLLVRIGRQLEAVGYYEQAADRYAEIGLFNNAIALCNKALRYQPDHVELMRKLGHFSASQGFLTDARRYFLQYAEHKFAAGDTDSAFAALEDFAGVADDGDVRELLGRRLQMHGRTEEALQALNRALALHQAAGDTDRAAAVTALIRALEPEPGAETSSPPPAPGADVLDRILDDEDEWRPAELAPADSDAAGAGDAGLDAWTASGMVAGPDVAEGTAPDGLDHDAAATHEAELAGLDLDQGAHEAPVELPRFEQLPGLETAAQPEWDDLGGSTVDGLETTMFDFGALTVDYGQPAPGLEIERAETSWDAEPRPFDYDVLDDADEDAADVDRAGEHIADERTPAESATDGPGEGRDVATPPLPDDLDDADPFAGGLAADAGSLPLLDEEGAGEDFDLPGGEDADLPLLGTEAGDLPYLTGGGDFGSDLPYLDSPADGPFTDADYLPVDEAVLPEAVAEPFEHLTGMDTDAAPHDAAAWEPGLPEFPADLSSHAADVAATVPAGGPVEPAPEPVEPMPEPVDVAVPPVEAAAESAAAMPGGGSTSDAEYVDLAALLQDEAQAGTRFTVMESAPTGDDDADFAELLSQFKEKVSEHLPTEDAAAHYDLALAFKEMGLLDDAIAEFQVAFRAAHMRLKICEELGDCFLRKGQYSIAEKVLQRGLGLPREDDLELLGVYYHLGRTYEELGRTVDARDAYERVLSLDINFQDAAARLARL